MHKQIMESRDKIDEIRLYFILVELLNQLHLQNVNSKDGKVRLHTNAILVLL